MDNKSGDREKSII